MRRGAFGAFERVVARGGDGQSNAYDPELGDAASGCDLRLEHSGAQRPDHRSQWSATGANPGQLQFERRFSDAF
jgi:hypothetical protein